MVSTTLLEKLEQLSPELQKKIEDEVDGLLHKKTSLATEINFAEPQIKYGSMKGAVVYMADDFDAPLDDFKDYM